jgi:predicted O-methyltransferase YrrM
MNFWQKSKILAGKTRRQVNLENFRRLLKNPYLFFSFLRSLRASLKSQKLDRDTEIEEMPERLSDILESDEEELKGYWQEINDSEEFYKIFDSRWKDLKDEDVLRGTAGRLDAKFMYTLCRAVKPKTVIETGVRYGAFDAHLLAAMEKNGEGTLYSIDLPEAVKKYELGYLIPENLSNRWELRTGDSKEVLPELVGELETVDIFLHDSLHRPHHMRAEYNSVFPALSGKGVLASHDVFMTDTFQSFANEKCLDWRRINNLGLGAKIGDKTMEGDE